MIHPLVKEVLQVPISGDPNVYVVQLTQHSAEFMQVELQTEMVPLSFVMTLDEAKALSAALQEQIRRIQTGSLEVQP